MILYKFNHIYWVNIALAPGESKLVSPKTAPQNTPMEVGAPHPTILNSVKITSARGTRDRHHHSNYLQGT